MKITNLTDGDKKIILMALAAKVIEYNHAIIVASKIADKNDKSHRINHLLGKRAAVIRVEKKIAGGN